MTTHVEYEKWFSGLPKEDQGHLLRYFENGERSERFDALLLDHSLVMGTTAGGYFPGNFSPIPAFSPGDSIREFFKARQSHRIASRGTSR